MKPDVLHDIPTRKGEGGVCRHLLIQVDAEGRIQSAMGAWNPLEADVSSPLPAPGSDFFQILEKKPALDPQAAENISKAVRQALVDPSAFCRVEARHRQHGADTRLECSIAPLIANDAPAALVTLVEVVPARTMPRPGLREGTLKTLCHSSRIGSWELDLADLDDMNRNRLRWSDEIYRIFGHEVGDIEPSNEAFFQAVHPEDRQLVREAVSRTLRTHGHYSLDHRIILPTGEIRHIHEDARLCLDERTGRPLRMVGTALDITERKAAEEAFKSSGESQFHLAFANASVGFAITDTKGIILHINSHYCEITGYAEDELVGTSFAAITHPDDVKRKLELNQQLVAGEIDDFVVEKRYLRKDGGLAWVENCVSVIRNDEDGAVLHMLVLCKDITETRRNREQLRLLETCVAHFNDVVLITEAFPLGEPGPRIVFVNEAFTRRMGYTLEETLGRSPRFLQGPDTDRQALDRIRAALTAGRPVREELVNYAKDGSRVILDIDVVPIRGEDGRVTHFVAIQRDITIRREAEERLLMRSKRHEKRHAAIARLMRSGVLQAGSLDEAFRVISAEIAHAAEVERVSIWRYSPERDAIVCQELFEATPGSHSAGLRLPAATYPSYFRAMEENELISASDACRDPRTCEFAENYLNPLGITSMLDAPLHAGGALVGVLCQEHVGPKREWTAEDQSFALSMANFISLVMSQWEHRQIEETLRQQASLLDKANDAILVRDLDHAITYWNKGAEDLYGWTAEEALGRKACDLLYQDPAPFHQKFQRLMTDGEWKGEVRQVTKSGHEVVVEGSWTLVRDAADRPKCILAINKDVTEKKRLEDQMIRAQRMDSIGTLAGGIAHDLNNVLTPILMSVDLLKRRINDESSRDTLRVIASSAQRGAEMLSQVLSFARGMEGQSMPVSISRLLNDLGRIVQDTFPKNIELHLQTPPDEWMLSGDSTQIHQVLLNLCVNARDAMPAGGKLTVDTTLVMIDSQYATMNIEAREGPHIVIGVEDEGVGIAQEVLPKIFDPFFTTKPPGKGTGLGLSTSLAIVKSHGGFIRVRSEPGHGTRFTVYLPALPHSTEQTPEIEEQPLPRGNNELVLVIDDEAAVREITRQTLSAYGYRTLLAADGAEAVTLYSKHTNDIAVVLTDMAMPVMDGATTIQVLMKMNPQVRIIAASGVTAHGGMKKSAEAGARQFLPKPYTAETILRALRQVLHDENA